MKNLRDLAFDVVTIALALAYVLGYQAAGNVLLVCYWVLGAVGIAALVLVFLLLLAVDEKERRSERWDVWRKPRSWWRTLMVVVKVVFFASMGHLALAALLMLCSLLAMCVRGMAADGDSDRPDGSGALAAG